MKTSASFDIELYTVVCKVSKIDFYGDQISKVISLQAFAYHMFDWKIFSIVAWNLETLDSV